ncbi:hypothetical protein WJX79_010042 [Trebouxia sp. C0005]|nr:MAG: hypothetical protein FRX49_01531 [Trebouxia sp. A1-2]
MPFGRQHAKEKDKTMSGGVNDIGTGLQAVAAAITDPDTVSAFQSEHRDGDMSHRTFYGGMHELAGGLDHAANGIQGLSQSVHHVADSFASIAHAIDQLAKSVVSLQGAIQPLSRSINHVAAGGTAVGLTFLYGASGSAALILGITLLLGLLLLFHFLLEPSSNAAIRDYCTSKLTKNK